MLGGAASAHLVLHCLQPRQQFDRQGWLLHSTLWNADSTCSSRIGVRVALADYVQHSSTMGSTLQWHSLLLAWPVLGSGQAVTPAATVNTTCMHMPLDANMLHNAVLLRHINQPWGWGAMSGASP